MTSVLLMVVHFVILAYLLWKTWWIKCKSLRCITACLCSPGHLMLHFSEADSLNPRARMLQKDCICAHSDADFGQKRQAWLLQGNAKPPARQEPSSAESLEAAARGAVTDASDSVARHTWEMGIWPRKTGWFGSTLCKTIPARSVSSKIGLLKRVTELFCSKN